MKGGPELAQEVGNWKLLIESFNLHHKIDSIHWISTWLYIQRANHNFRIHKEEADDLLHEIHRFIAAALYNIVCLPTHWAGPLAAFWSLQKNQGHRTQGRFQLKIDAKQLVVVIYTSVIPKHERQKHRGQSPQHTNSFS